MQGKLGSFIVDSQLTIKEILTVIPILLTFFGLLYAWYKDRQLKRKEYADRIRRAAGSITAKLERWGALSLRFFEDIQPLITDSDIMLTKEQNALLVRDFFWRGLVSAHAKSSRRILNEEIEIAYADLYGYDPRIQDLFTGALHFLNEIDNLIYSRVLDATQQDVLMLSTVEGHIESADLGNALRETCGMLQIQLKTGMDQVIHPFRDEVLKLIRASDSKIVNKGVQISEAEKVFHRILTPRSNTTEVQNYSDECESDDKGTKGSIPA